MYMISYIILYYTCYNIRLAHTKCVFCTIVSSSVFLVYLTLCRPCRYDGHLVAQRPWPSVRRDPAAPDRPRSAAAVRPRPEVRGQRPETTPPDELEADEGSDQRHVSQVQGRPQKILINIINLYYDFDWSILKMFCSKHLLGCYCHPDYVMCMLPRLIYNACELELIGKLSDVQKCKQVSKWPTGSGSARARSARPAGASPTATGRL